MFQSKWYGVHTTRLVLNCTISQQEEGGGGVLTCLEKTAMSSLKDSEEQTSPPATPGSRGVQVANSHFSKIRASRGNRGWLQQNKVFYQLAQTVSECTTAILIYGNADFENSREFGICLRIFHLSCMFCFEVISLFTVQDRTVTHIVYVTTERNVTKTTKNPNNQSLLLPNSIIRHNKQTLLRN